jgi:hypothetical protein
VIRTFASYFGLILIILSCIGLLWNKATGGISPALAVLVYVLVYVLAISGVTILAFAWLVGPILHMLFG